MELINQMKEKIILSKNVALFGHINVDGDCVGSVCSMALLLKNLNKNVEIFLDCTVPEYLRIIPECENFNKTEFDVNKFDLLISIDTATASRLGNYSETFKNFENTLLIDHHISNSKYAKYCYIEPYASSCGEVMFKFFTKCGFDISKDMASAMLGAIVSDTNNFTNSDVTSETFEVTSKLISLNADFNKIIYATQKQKSLIQVRVASFMAKKIKLKNNISHLIVSEKDCKKLRCAFSDISKFMSLITNIDDSKITVVFKQKGKDLWSVSFRSINNYDVNAVASQFGGGGHINASGCVVKGKISKIKKEVLNACENQIKFVEANNAK